MGKGLEGRLSDLSEVLWVLVVPLRALSSLRTFLVGGRDEVGVFERFLDGRVGSAWVTDGPGRSCVGSVVCSGALEVSRLCAGAGSCKRNAVTWKVK